MSGCDRPTSSGGRSDDLRPPSRRSEVPSFIVMDVMRAAAALEAAGRSVIHMEVGQPATPAPRAAREAVRRALETDNLGYTLALGIDPLRESVARLYQDRYGVTLPADSVAIIGANNTGLG